MIPITLVVGFLGSGKTTLMRRIIAAQANRQIVYLVNEFSARDVDSHLLRHETDRVLPIAGGSIFCKCLVSEFIQHLGRIAGLQSPVRRHWDGVVIEASGMANPKSILTMLSETKLDQIYTLSQVICIVDPGSFFKLLTTLPAIRDQVEAADLVLINKTDLFNEAEAEKIESKIREFNPGASVSRTVRCEIHIDLNHGAPVGMLEGFPYDDPNPALMGFDITPQEPFDVSRAKQLAEELGDALYRLKGFVKTDSETLALDATLAGWSTTPAPVDSPLGLVLIGPTKASSALKRFADLIAKT